MTMWLIIMWTTLALTGAALVYVSNRTCQFGCIKCLTKESEKRKAAIGGGIVFGLFLVVGYWLNFMNAIVCVIYFAMAWLFCDLLFCIISRSSGKKFQRYYAGGIAIALATGALLCGWYLNHHVWQTQYTIYTDKNVKPLKIAMFADSHLGTTFNAEGLAEHLEKIEAQKPDLLLIAGDFVDDGTTRDDMLKAAHALGNIRTKHGVYFVFGNHDNGYYGPQYRGFSGAELVAALEENNVKVLRDEFVLLDEQFYLIGRRDYSVEKEQHGKRLSMAELVQNLNRDKYLIVGDHQPTDYENQAAAEVDLVLSGHTHGGQLWPFNQVGKWIGANDRIYGHEKRNKTDFVVTSGLSDWTIKFKTGTKSEFVIINVQSLK